MTWLHMILRPQQIAMITSNSKCSAYKDMQGVTGCEQAWTLLFPSDETHDAGNVLNVFKSHEL